MIVSSELTDFLSLDAEGVKLSSRYFEILQLSGLYIKERIEQIYEGVWEKM